MELEKLKMIIADVLNVDTAEITEDTTFVSGFSGYFSDYHGNRRRV